MTEKKKLKVAVIGSRSLTDYDVVEEAMEPYRNRAGMIVSGGARGTDRLAEEWAKENEVETLIFLPDPAHGRGGYRIRNEKIVESADMVVAFWDGKSRGTKMVIEMCKDLGVPVEIVKISSDT